MLHFQIFAVDENNQAYPTDLQCQTEPIYEYDRKFVIHCKTMKFILLVFQRKNSRVRHLFFKKARSNISKSDNEKNLKL